MKQYQILGTIRGNETAVIAERDVSYGWQITVLQIGHRQREVEDVRPIATARNRKGIGSELY